MSISLDYIFDVPPAPPPEGRVIVHDRHESHTVLGVAGFRAWMQYLMMNR
jgi:hypothetical protein